MTGRRYRICIASNCTYTRRKNNCEGKGEERKKEGEEEEEESIFGIFFSLPVDNDEKTEGNL